MITCYTRIARITTLLLITTTTGVATAASIFKTVRPLLAQKSTQPIVLPPSRTIKTVLNFNRELTANNIELNTSLAYSLNFDFLDNCHGAAPCSIGNFFSASLKKQTIPHNDAQSFPLSMNQIQSLTTTQPLKTNDHRTIKINPSHTGYLENSHSTGTGSSLFRTLTWVNNHRVFQLTLKGFSAKSMIKVAQATLSQ